MTEDRSALVRDLVTPLASGKGWIKFLGIITIVGAALSVLSTFGLGLLVAWLPIWMGVLLWQSGGALERAQMSGDEASMRMALGKLRTYFVIQGILIVISFALVLMVFVLGIGSAIFSGMHHAL
ncbi:DUF5362 domain-containing protein [Oleiagrimonas sp. C23AA]|nr:DUF5362 domain-containing protein [Oleiagrimonas sp. C23AA]